MSQPEVSYRQQWVSGVVAIEQDQFPAFATTYVVNPGTAAGTAKVQYWRTIGPVLVSEEEFAVAAGGFYRVFPFALPAVELELSPDLYWAVIWTTSQDLVPTCVFSSTAPGEQSSGQDETLAYFAPGDFAQLTLPYHPGPPVPPVPPIPPIAP
jgi:hypothetical protein